MAGDTLKHHGDYHSRDPIDAGTVNEMLAAHRDLEAVRDAHYNPELPDEWVDLNYQYREHFVGQIVSHGPNGPNGQPLADFEDARYWVREVTDSTGPRGDEEEPWHHVIKRPNLLPHYYDLVSAAFTARRPPPEVPPTREDSEPAYDPQLENPVRWVPAINLAEYHPTDPAEDTHELAPDVPTCDQHGDACTSDDDTDSCCKGLICVGGICEYDTGACGAIGADCGDEGERACCKGLLCVGGKCMGGYSGELVHVYGFTASDGLRRFFFDRSLGGGGGVYTAVLRAVDVTAKKLTIQLVKTIEDKIVGTGDMLEAYPILGQPIEPFTLPGFARPESDDEDFGAYGQAYYPFLAFKEEGIWRVTFPLNMPKNMRSDIGQARAVSEGGRD